METDNLPKILVKRIYDPASPDDGLRILVDRLWPRGLKKNEAHIDTWMKEVAPSPGLRKWFSHDPQKWEEFQQDYRFELNKSQAARDLINQIKTNARITLLYAAKDESHNNALVLRDFLNRHLGEDTGKP